jgi:16S rRNA (cytidine1402-2'-O)-methyltransferase
MPKQNIIVSKSGTLYIVATPIGNLQDISARAVKTLQEVDCICCEDTRHSLKLLNYLGIRKPLMALHEHNESYKCDEITAKLKQNQSIALISDAGTPLISDPGYRLVQQARLQDLPVVTIPGPCAAVAALSIAGLSSHHFYFAGFLPAKTAAKQSELEALQLMPATLIFYESPHRLLKTLEQMVRIFGEQRQVVLAKELTKLYETVYYNTLGDLLEQLKHEKIMGEWVILVAEAPKATTQQISQSQQTSKILTLLLEELPLKQAVNLTAKICSEKKNDIYQQALALKAQL